MLLRIGSSKRKSELNKSYFLPLRCKLCILTHNPEGRGRWTNASLRASCCPESAGAERERRGVRTGKGAATVWVEASKNVTWSAGCSLSSTQRQCHLKVDPPQLQHFLHSDGSGEEHPLVWRFYILTPDFFFFFTSTISLSPPLSPFLNTITMYV